MPDALVPSVDFARLRAKWETIPFSADGRRSGSDLLALDDADFLAAWEFARRATSDGPVGFNLRGWYQLVYRDWTRGKKILDIGVGLGIDSIYFAQCGAHVTFVDLVPTNIRIVERVCALKGITNCLFRVIESIDDIAELDTDYDGVFAFGSLLHAPESMVQREVQLLSQRLKPGGRFIMHAYPKARWQREGELPFDRWGEKTDGAGTPWAEWYDVAKLQRLLRPARFVPVMYCEYRNGDMNCIDLMDVTHHPAFAEPEIPSTARLLPGVGLDSLLSCAEERHGRVERHGTAATVTTPSSPWEYAAELRIDRSQLRSHGPYYLEMQVEVQRGTVAIGALHLNQRDFVTERRFEAGEEARTVVLVIASLDDVHSVIVRNTNQPIASRVVFRSLRLYEAI